MPCNKCGGCCQVIILMWNHAELQHEGSKLTITKIGREIERTNNDEINFIAKNFKPISLKTAMRLNPHYTLALQKAIGRDNGPSIRGRLYTCRKYNPRTKSCRVQNHKYYICSGYPYYENTYLPSHHVFASVGCGYKITKVIKAADLKGVIAGQSADMIIVDDLEYLEVDNG